jgi:hypothetical protein
MVDRTDAVSKWAAVAGMMVTAGTMIWQMSGIAHDVGEVKAAVGEMRTDAKAKDDRLYALEGRVTKLETSVSMMEERKP